jgi:membrane protein implicated in regulation of membrane protease activity
VSLVGVFVYGIVVFALVAVALGLIAWGIVNERRDRVRYEQGREVFGERAAMLETASDREVAAG